jgi:hypothetical protein
VPLVRASDLLRTASAFPVAFSTGFPTVDELLGGRGVPTGEVLELLGEPGSGKTQLCHSVAAMAARTGANVLYVDSKNSFSPLRALAFLENKARGITSSGSGGSSSGSNSSSSSSSSGGGSDQSRSSGISTTTSKEALARLAVVGCFTVGGLLEILTQASTGLSLLCVCACAWCVRVLWAVGCGRGMGLRCCRSSYLWLFGRLDERYQLGRPCQHAARGLFALWLSPPFAVSSLVLGGHAHHSIFPFALGGRRGSDPRACVWLLLLLRACMATGNYYHFAKTLGDTQAPPGSGGSGGRPKVGLLVVDSITPLLGPHMRQRCVVVRESWCVVVCRGEGVVGRGGATELSYPEDLLRTLLARQAQAFTTTACSCLLLPGLDGRGRVSCGSRCPPRGASANLTARPTTVSHCHPHSRRVLVCVAVCLCCRAVVYEVAYLLRRLAAEARLAVVITNDLLTVWENDSRTGAGGRSGSGAGGGGGGEGGGVVGGVGGSGSCGGDSSSGRGGGGGGGGGPGGVGGGRQSVAGAAGAAGATGAGGGGWASRDGASVKPALGSNWTDVPHARLLLHKRTNDDATDRRSRGSPPVRRPTSAPPFAAVEVLRSSHVVRSFTREW